jgi:KDO2-lipid IV(A) lauroyltransferase
MKIMVPLAGDFIGLLWFDVLRIRRKVAIENVGIAFPEMSLAERTRIARWSLRHMGRSLIEYLYFYWFDDEDMERFFEFSGKEYVEAALKEGKGAFLLGLHIGNGDFATVGISRVGFPTSLISKTFKWKALNDFWFGVRAKHGTRFIAPEKSSFEILRALRQNRVVIFVLDQFMGPPIGCRTRFFGKETGTAMGLAIMADRTRSPVIPVYTYRKKDGRHAVVFSAPVPWQDVGPNADRDANIAAMTQVYTDKIEEAVRKHPEQWMWIHRRWKNFG